MSPDPGQSSILALSPDDVQCTVALVSCYTGNSDDEGYGDVRFISQARLASARTQYPAQTHKHIPTERDPPRLLVGTPSLMGLSSGSQTLDCFLGKC